MNEKAVTLKNFFLPFIFSFLCFFFLNMDTSKQSYNVLSMIADLLPSDKKDKAPELNEIFTQFITHSVDFPEASAKLQNLIGTDEPIKKLAESMNREKKRNIPQVPQFAGFRKKARPWSNEEDQRLKSAIQVHGIENWPLVATIVGGNRTRSQCSQRWHRVLDPKINKNNWTMEEETKLLNAVKKYGNKAWTRIAADMGDRCDVQCRFRYKFLLQKAGNNPDEVKPVSVSQAMQTQNASQNSFMNNGEQNTDNAEADPQQNTDNPSNQSEYHQPVDVHIDNEPK